MRTASPHPQGRERCRDALAGSQGLALEGAAQGCGVLRQHRHDRLRGTRGQGRGWGCVMVPEPNPPALRRCPSGCGMPRTLHAAAPPALVHLRPGAQACAHPHPSPARIACPQATPSHCSSRPPTRPLTACLMRLCCSPRETGVSSSYHTTPSYHASRRCKRAPSSTPSSSK